MRNFFIKLISSEDTNSRNIIDHIDDDNIKNYINQRIFSDEFKQSDEVIFNNIIDRIMDIKRRYFQKELENLTVKIKLAELYKDETGIKESQEEKMVLSYELTQTSKLQELKK